MFDVISGKNNTDDLQIIVFEVQDRDRSEYIDLPAYGKRMYWTQPSDGQHVRIGKMGYAFVASHSLFSIHAFWGMCCLTVRILVARLR